MLALARDKGKESYQVFRMNKISRKQDMFTARHSGTRAHEHQASALWKARRHGFGVVGMGGASMLRTVVQDWLLKIFALSFRAHRTFWYQWWIWIVRVKNCHSMTDERPIIPYEDSYRHDE